MNLRHKLHSALSDYQGLPFKLQYWDGEEVRFGHGQPAFNLNFKKEAALARAISESSLGLGESYADGDVTVEGNLEDVLTALGAVYLKMEPEGLLTTWARKARTRALHQEKSDVEHHYGLGNDFYRFYLDKSLQYSCAYFIKPDDSLDQAQDQKIAYTAAKLHLQPGQRLLSLGCGWGCLMFHAAKTYGVSCLGITLCENQAAYIRQQAAQQGLPVEVKVLNYQELDERDPYDRIESVGMMEHVGESRANAFCDKVKALLKPGAICLLHCIAKMKESSGSDPFVEKHIFPGYWFFSLEGMTRHAADRGLNVLDVENLRRHYLLTARHWRRNFLANYDPIKAAKGFDDRFMRMWEFYLASVAAGFRLGYLNLIQMVLSNGINDEYPLTRHSLYQTPVEAVSMVEK